MLNNITYTKPKWRRIYRIEIWDYSLRSSGAQRDIQKALDIMDFECLLSTQNYFFTLMSRY